jgi:hypothetical protein
MTEASPFAPQLEPVHEFARVAMQRLDRTGRAPASGEPEYASWQVVAGVAVKAARVAWQSGLRGDVLRAHVTEVVTRYDAERYGEHPTIRSDVWAPAVVALLDAQQALVRRGGA